MLTKRTAFCAALLMALVLPSVHPGAASAAAVDPLVPLSFLEGSWDARTAGGSADAKAIGSYTFVRELAGHVLVRHSEQAGCKGPDTFDCRHGDVLYVYGDGPAGALKAIYFDSEGHVIHYDVSTPDAQTAVFLSEPGPGPQFQLVYHEESGVMSGKFQTRMPGQSAWTSYLEWSGAKK